MNNTKKTVTLILIALAMAVFGLCSCGGFEEDNGVVPKALKGKWEMCGFAPKDKDIAAENIITGDALQDEYGVEPDKLHENTVEFNEGGGMAP